MVNNLRHLYRSFKYKESDFIASDESALKLFWWNDRANLGDAINLYIAERISKKKIEWVPNNYSKQFYTCIGSVLQLANDKATVWGSGYISEKAKFLRKPKDVFAVRGPLTRKLLGTQGVKCPEVYGDPALLAPLFFDFQGEKKFKLGIIPHFVDKGASFFEKEIPDDVKVLDIETDNVERFLQDMMECEKIISSSLHGVILADAYNIPSVRVKFSNKITGGDFKFNDYAMSVEREVVPPMYINRDTRWLDIYNANFNYHLNIETAKLLNSCPFRSI